MMAGAPRRDILLKLALAAALLTLAVAARLPFMGNTLAGEEGYFAALVLNSEPTSALDDKHLPREIAGVIDGKPVLQTFRRTVMPYIILERLGRVFAARHALGHLPPEKLSIAARLPFAIIFLLGSAGLIALAAQAAASADKRVSAAAALAPLSVALWALTTPLAVSASLQPQLDGSVGVLLLGTAGTLLAVGDIGQSAGRWRFLAAGTLSGLGKHEWALAFAAAALGAAIVTLLLSAERRTTVLAFAAFLLGLALAVALSYAISPDDYRDGWQIMTTFYSMTGGQLWAIEPPQWSLTLPVVALVLLDGAFLALVLRRLLRTAPGLLLAYLGATAIAVGYTLSGWHGDNFPRYLTPPLVILPTIFVTLWLRFGHAVVPAVRWMIVAAALLGLGASYTSLAESHRSGVALGDLRGEPLAKLAQDYAAAAKLGRDSHGVVFTVTTTWVYHQEINFISAGLGKTDAIKFVASHFPAYEGRIVFPPQ
jgi:hypothetical protein